MPSREVHCTDGVAWVASQAFGPQHAIVTSLPDSSELPSLGFEGWRKWFVETSRLICERTHDDGVAIFFQTDVKRDGAWVDKGFLVSLGAEQAGSRCLWHKVVCRAPAGMTTFGRPAYAHLLCFSRKKSLEKGQASPDVLPTLGQMPWARAMGVDACEAVARFLVQHTSARVVVDPFCGLGTMLAVANQHGLDAVGVELSVKRAARARELTVDPRGGKQPV